MNASILVLDSSEWLSLVSDAVYIGCLAVGLFSIVVACCMVAQTVTDGHDSGGHKRRPHMVR